MIETAVQSEAPGLPARRIAADILDGVLRRRRALDELFDGRQAPAGLDALADRDRALVRHIVATALRRLGSLRYLLDQCLDRGLPKEAPRVESALLVGATQILFLDVPDHAAVDLSVRLVRADRHAARYSKLANAVLRRIARQGADMLGAVDTILLDTPSWLMERWTRHYGTDVARAIALANRAEPALDLTVKSDPEAWARGGGNLLPTGSVRLIRTGRCRSFRVMTRAPGGCRTPQRAPVRLFGDVRGHAVADLCAAPGGKPPNWRAWVRKSPPSIDRRRASSGCARISRACRLRPTLSRPTPRRWRPVHSMAS
jgi:16S rRNA (cytosine967-C5)-methyltransferase